jgi:hypothetical protein
MSPARLLILAGWPARTRLTSWLMMNSAVSSGSPKARTTARIRGTYPWWSAPHRKISLSNPRRRLSR